MAFSVLPGPTKMISYESKRGSNAFIWLELPYTRKWRGSHGRSFISSYQLITADGLSPCGVGRKQMVGSVFPVKPRRNSINNRLLDAVMPPPTPKMRRFIAGDVWDAV